jgi:Xaa-Pro aminopeptidase
MKFVFIVSLLFTLIINIPAQPLQLDQEIFKQRRATFMEKMDSNAVAIFPCKPEYSRNLDVNYPYRQESNFYYLSGFEEPQSILLISPSDPNNKYVMFVRKKDPRREVWEGARAGIEDAMTEFMADTALNIEDIKQTLDQFTQYDRTIYYTFGINPEYDRFIRDRFVEKRSRGNWPIIDPAPILNQMRLIKNEGDWKMGLKKAIDISAAAHEEAIRALKPGMYEYEVQAIFEFVYRRNGSPRNAYPCIIGSGPNSTILHYDKNNRRLEEGEMILMDCAAEYGYYSADITRTVPTSGTFTKEQRDIYSIVLDAQNQAMAMVKPGIILADLDKKINEVLANSLIALGLIKDTKDLWMFSRHGYSHWIGLEVHDVGAYKQNGKHVALEPGMVFTIEPGLYVRPDIADKMKTSDYTESEIDEIRSRLEDYMHIGVRIEDDILVTDTGFENLSKALPREIADIEDLMEESPRWINHNSE